MPPVAAPAATFSVPVLSISLTLGMVLERMCSTSTFSVSGLLSRCSLQVTIETDVPRGAWDGAWDGSALIIWAIATGTAALASYLAASEHKMQDQEMRAALRDNKRSPDLAADLASVAASTIDTTTAVAFLLVMASASLLTLYFLLQVGLASVLLFLINLAFILVTATASAEVFLLPLLMTLCPNDLQEASIRLSRAAVTSAAPDAASACAETAVPAEATRTAPPAAEDSEALQLLPLVSSLTALAISISWFIYRKEPWMWLVQDGLSMAVCILFVRTIRLPSLKLATFFLCLMFLYDICMVFISPLVFHKSVMLEVATAGASTRSIGEHGQCVRTRDENMPMLMAVPRMSPYTSVYDGVFSPPLPLLPPLVAEEALGVGSWLWRLSGAPGDYGIIGLGDIVLPALVVPALVRPPSRPRLSSERVVWLLHLCRGWLRSGPPCDSGRQCLRLDFQRCARPAGAALPRSGRDRFPTASGCDRVRAPGNLGGPATSPAPSQLEQPQLRWLQCQLAAR